MADTDGFDWSTQKSIVVKRVDAIAIYKNKAGDIIIRQERSTTDDDAVITVPIQNAYSVIEALTREVKGPFPPPLPPLT